MPPKLRLCAPALGAWCLVLFSACASGPQPAAEPAPRELRALSEPAALTLLDRLLLEHRQLPVEGWRVRLAERTDFEVDLRLGNSRFGIEWVSARDRALDGAALPQPDPGGQLRVVSAMAAPPRSAAAVPPMEASGPALILVLDDRSYARDARESAWERERALEQRLRADVGDFIAYVAQAQ